jgi:8-oxo-dGTP diphosphatase
VIIDLISKTWKLLPRTARTFITRRIQPKFTASVVGIVLNDEGKVLLLEHVLRPKSGWGLAGGFIEAGEQPHDALRRELMEETGLQLRDIELYRSRTLRRHIEIIFFAKAVGEAEVKSREIKQLMWASIDEMPPEMSLDFQFMIKQALESDIGAHYNADV